MKKYQGIARNKYPQYHQSKQTTLKKKNRFKLIGKDQDIQFVQQPQTNSLITSSTSQHQVSFQSETHQYYYLYEQAKQHLKQVQDYKEQIITQCKLRITAFKQTQAKKYDQNISNLSKNAIQHLLLVQKKLTAIKQLKGQTQSQQKYYRNIQKSLAQQLRQLTKQLRTQQKRHFDRLKAYQKGTANTAIQLSQTQKQKMKGDIDFSTQMSQRMIQQQQQHHRDSQINQLVQSINKLSLIYKQLNQLVVQQGSIIDRIDFNIQETLSYTKKANQHLISAQDKASSSCAMKCMIVLLSLIIVFAIILGIKYSK